MGGNFSIAEGDSVPDVDRKLQIRQTALSTLLVLQFIGGIYLLTQSLVTGYCIVDAGVNGTALPHMIWVIAAFAVSFGGAFTTRFEVGLYTDTITSGVYFFYVLCAMAIVANGIALGFFVWELVQGLSNFYTQSFGFLIATIVVTSIFILLDVISIVAARIFHRDLLRALEIGWRPSYKRTNPLYYYKKTSTTVVDEEDGGADEMRKVALNKSSINTRVTERTHLLKKQLIKD